MSRKSKLEQEIIDACERAIATGSPALAFLSGYLEMHYPDVAAALLRVSDAQLAQDEAARSRVNAMVGQMLP